MGAQSLVLLPVMWTGAGSLGPAQTSSSPGAADEEYFNLGREGFASQLKKLPGVLAARRK